MHCDTLLTLLLTNKCGIMEVGLMKTYCTAEAGQHWASTLEAERRREGAREGHGTGKKRRR